MRRSPSASASVPPQNSLAIRWIVTTVAAILTLCGSCTHGFSVSRFASVSSRQQRPRPQSSSSPLMTTTTTRSKRFVLVPQFELRAAQSSQDDQDTSNSKETPSQPLDDDNDNNNATEEEDNASDISTTTTASTSTSTTEPKKSLWQRLKAPFQSPDDGLTFRQRLTKMGLAVVLSYGWVSNMSYCVSVSAAWYIFNKQTGLSPLAPGQWKKFLAVYAGFYVFNNLVRPLRLAASVAVSSQFERLVQGVQTKLRLKRKGMAVFLTVFLVNVVGTLALMSSLIAGAAALSGVPVFPAKVV